MRINEEITAPQVRLVGENIPEQGVFSLRDALRMADEQELDLVEISAKADPPVCRIMDDRPYRERYAPECDRTLLVVIQHICRFAGAAGSARISDTARIHDIALAGLDCKVRRRQGIDAAACPSEKNAGDVRMPNVTIHGADVHDYALIGMGSTLLDGVVVGEGAIVAAGSLVLKNTQIGPYEVWGGVPAKFIKKADPEQTNEINRKIAHNYAMYASWYKQDEE